MKDFLPTVMHWPRFIKGNTLLSRVRMVFACVPFVAMLYNDVWTVVCNHFFCIPSQLGLGVAEGLADLYAKLSVSQRQLDGAKSAGGGGGKKASEKSRKIQGLENQV